MSFLNGIHLKRKSLAIGPNLRITMPGIITLPQHFANRGYSVAGYGKIFDPRSTPANQDVALSWPDGQADRGASETYFESGKWQVVRDTDSNNAFATDNPPRLSPPTRSVSLPRRWTRMATE